MSRTEQLSRWRLILGQETEQSFTQMGGVPLTQEELLMDSALGAIYGGPGEGFGGPGQGAGKGPSSPVISTDARQIPPLASKEYRSSRLASWMELWSVRVSRR